MLDVVLFLAIEPRTAFPVTWHVLQLKWTLRCRVIFLKRFRVRVVQGDEWIKPHVAALTGTALRWRQEASVAM